MLPVPGRCKLACLIFTAGYGRFTSGPWNTCLIVNSCYGPESMRSIPHLVSLSPPSPSFPTFVSPVPQGLTTTTDLPKLAYPSNFPAGSRTDVPNPSDTYNIDYEDLYLPTPDGEKLHAYLMLQREPRGRKMVFICHANAGNMGHRVPIAAKFYKEFGWNVFIFSYRGYASPSSLALGCVLWVCALWVWWVWGEGVRRCWDALVDACGLS